MPPAFLADDNLCGNTLLRLVARGNSIITELFRLARNLPPYLSHLADVPQAGGGLLLDPDQAKYQQVLFGFAYLKDQDEFEKRINQSTELTDIDTEFQENNHGLLERFYSLFESILKYHEDLQHFVEDVNNGFYIQHTLSTILLDTAGKQLMCEAVYLFGMMLLMMETYLPGPTREKIVVAYYRKSGGQSSLDSFDDIVRLCRSTGYVQGLSKSRPKNYPESFFGRLPLPKELVRLCIGRLQSDDVYLASTAFPNPDQRSTALAGQGAMLYVLLYFSVRTLVEEGSTMREIVDRHFNDNWIITLYMGHVVDLSLEWAGYKAAKAALDNVLQVQHVSTLATRNGRLITDCIGEVKGYLVESIMTEQFVTDNINALIDCARRCNVALRWRMLHRRTSNRKFYDLIVTNGTSPDVIMTLLLQTAQLEWRLKSMLEKLLGAKDGTCEECKAQSVARLTELSDFFSGDKALTRVEKNENLMRWFASTAAEVKGLEYDEEHATMSGRKIKEFISALQDVQQFEELDTNLQIKAYLQETCEFLFQIVRTVNLKQSDLLTMDTVSDTSYAWHVITDYVDVIHARVKADPSTVVLLRATLLKLASMLDTPLMRIHMCDSPDTISVAQYYSSELVDFLRRVLEIIPKSVFRNLLEIVDIQTNRMKPVPIKLEAVNLRDYAQLDERYLMAKLTHRVSVFTEGILAMEKTLLGVIQVDPRRILEEGLRKELVRKVSEAMHELLVFPSSSSGQEVGRVMGRLALRMSAFQRSSEYVQDYIDLPGLKLWQQELSRVVYYNIEQECNRFLKKKVYDHQSAFQSRAIPIPRFPPLDPESSTFMGRVLSAVLRLTDPRSTIYSPECGGWFNATDGSELCGISTFSTFNRAIGVIGLGGLDRLLAFHIVHELQLFLHFYRHSVREHSPFLEQLQDRLFPPTALPEGAPKLYAQAKTTLEKVMSPALQSILRVGQAQLLRKCIAKELLFVCRMDASLYQQALDTLNRSILSDVRQHYRRPDSAPYPSDKNPLLAELTLLLEKSGMDDPFCRIYVTSDPVEGLAAFLLVFTISYLPKLVYDPDFGTLVRKKPTYPLDGAVLIAGLVTVLRQFHPIYTAQYLRLLAQYVRVSIDSVYKPGSQRYSGSELELPSEVMMLTIFMRDLARDLSLPKDVVATLIPPHLVPSVKQ